MKTKTENELWDIYTKDREKTGRVHRRGDKMNGGEYHMVVHVCIFNGQNQLLIQKRQPFKKGWPNMWDITAGGSALQGESSCQAAEREVFEEIGLKLDLSDARPDFTINFEDGFDDYYLLEREVELSDLRLQEDEVQAVRWAGREEALDMLAQGIMIPYWFLDRLFEVRGYDAHGKQERDIRVVFATPRQLASWMSLAEILRDNFPGLETEELFDGYRETVLRNMERHSAICALHGNIVAGILLFSEKRNMLTCMAVHPEYRRSGIATKMVGLMLTRLDRTRDIVVTTFREDDPRGSAPRALYQSLGFAPAELVIEQGHPSQVFVLKGENRDGEDMPEDRQAPTEYTEGLEKDTGTAKGIIGRS